MALNFSFLNPYPSNLKGKDIKFETEYGNKYEIYFADADGYFEEYEFAPFVKNFGFRQLPPYGPKIYSSRIAETILFHIIEFLEDDRHVLGYVCDQSDNRQIIRSKLFNKWFKHYSTSEYVKYDYEFESTLFLSLITKRSNPFLEEFQNTLPKIGIQYK